MKDFNEFIEYRKPLKRVMDSLSESDGIMLESMFYEFHRQQKSKSQKSDSLPCVSDCFLLRFRLKWVRLVFRFKYPDTADSITWLSAYDKYLRKCHEIRTKLNDL